jgi:cellulose synthase (UDP-forming)
VTYRALEKRPIDEFPTEDFPVVSDTAGSKERYAGQPRRESRFARWHRFLVFGSISLFVFLVGTVLQWVLLKPLGADNSYISQTVFSVELSYALNRWLNWRDRDVRLLPSLAKWNAQKLVLTVPNIVGYDLLLRVGMNWLTANLAATAAFTIVNYVVADKWTFIREYMAYKPALEMSPYAGTSEISGKLHTGNKVRYIKTLSTRQRLTLWTILGVSLTSCLVLLAWLGWMTDLTLSTDGAGSESADMSIISISVLMALIEGIRVLQSLTLGYCTAMACDPVPLMPNTKLRVAVLTTIVPGSEPWELVKETLQEMLQIRHPGIMDVWLLDEGNDPAIKADCFCMGVRHFSRRGVEEWNTPSGPYRRKSKSGNHNSWRARFERNYDVVAQMDPDHIPVPEFLERTLGYFNDPDVGFVVAPQVYGRNMNESWVARASAVLAYIFHGVIQRGLNGLRAPLLIGTNHLYRTTCWHQVGGYRDRLVEDHATCMQVYAAENPATGNRWTGVYTPDIIADGEGPSSFTDFFNQQRRWAYGIWQIIFTDSGRTLPKLSVRQRIAFTMLQQFYPSVCISWLASMLLTALFLFSGVVTHLPIAQWAVLWSISVTSSLFLFFWLRRFNLVEHERKQWGMAGVYLMLMSIPTYVQAGLAYCFGCPLTYKVTAKGDLGSSDRVKTFSANLCWLLVAVTFCLFPSFLATHLWMAFVAVICAAPVIMHYYKKFQVRGN